MTEIRKPAVKIMQGERSLFLTYFTVRDFMVDGFYTVDRLDVQESTGMQRLLNTARAMSFSRDIIGADKENQAFLPTSIFLATGGSISYDENHKELFFESAEHAGICPLDVVDGQHRIEGLKIAATQNNRLLDFRIASIIGSDMKRTERMLQFLTVNTKQQKVGAGVEQSIIAQFSKMYEIEPLPHLPSWLRKKVAKGTIDESLTIVKYLNSDKESIWYKRVQFANEKKLPHHTINQKSFVNSIEKHLLTQSHPLPNDKQKKIHVLKNFWEAVGEIFIPPSNLSQEIVNSVVLKSTGVEFFHSISAPVINRVIQKFGKYEKDSIKEILLSAEGYLSGDIVAIMSPEYWISGNQSSGLNSGAIAKLASAFSEALDEAHDDNTQF